MAVTAALCLLAAAIWLAGARRHRRDGRRGGPPGHRHARQRVTAAGRRRPGLPPRAVPWVVAGGVLVAAVSLFGSVAGSAVTAVLAPLGVLAIRRLDARSHSMLTVEQRRNVPLMLDLLATALRAGQPFGTALAITAPVAGGRLAGELTQAAGLLRLGAEPATAWQPVRDDPVLDAVARTVCRSAESGIRLARGFEQAATQLRAEQAATARARAQRAGVWAMAPLGLCFLPAFVCLGVLPVIVGVAREVFTGLSL